MKVREIKVSLDTTINIGNFENYKIGSEITVTLSDTDNLNDAYKKAWNIVADEIREKRKAIADANKG